MNETLFDFYISDVRSQLNCNASKEDKEQFVTYSYMNYEINEHLDYFKRYFDAGMSAHMALELFNEHHKHVNMDNITHEKLIIANEYCLVQDMSATDAYIYMAKYAGVTADEVHLFIRDNMKPIKR